MEKLNCNLTNYAFDVIKQIKNNSLNCCYEHYFRASKVLMITGSPFLALTERLENVIICNYTHISLCSSRKRSQANPRLVTPSTFRYIYSSVGSCVPSGKQSHTLSTPSLFATALPCALLDTQAWFVHLQEFPLQC